MPLLLLRHLTLAKHFISFWVSVFALENKGVGLDEMGVTQGIRALEGVQRPVCPPGFVLAIP